MPKERLHLYLADELLKRCENLRVIPASQSLFYVGAISPDIFYYDLPGFSLSPFGNELHDLIDREGISIIYDWIGRSSSPARGEAEVGSFSAGAGKALWGLGLACHFLADAAWHPVINEMSRRGPGLWAEAGSSPHTPLPASRCCTSEIDCHRLIESELESFWLAGAPSPEKYNRLLKQFWNDRERLYEIASWYRGFFKFAGLGPGVSEKMIVRCFLNQNLLLRLFANRILGRQRDRLLSFSPTRFLGALVTPARPFLPALFSRILQEDGNPFSDCFMEKAIDFIETNLCH